MRGNEELFSQALTYIPGGVNSPVRAFKAVGGTPLFIKRGKGASIWDVEDKEYIDYVCSWGPLILGHAHPDVIQAVQQVAAQGLSFGAPTEAETEIAQTICQLLPSIEQLRLVSSGTEAAMSVIRLARGVTGRDKIVKFEGCYHGHVDSLLVKAGSGALTFGQPSSAGIPLDATAQTIVLDFNNTELLSEVFRKQAKEIAAIIVEPVAGNMNLIAPKAEFLNMMRDLCTKFGSLLIFDEVMTGFRVSLQGAQGLYGIKPDLTILGKVIGGGMPLGAFGGRRDVMAHLAPLGKVYQAGTLSGNPLSVAAGLATLKLVQVPGFYERLSATTLKLTQGLTQAAQKHSFCAQALGGMFGIYFRSSPPQTYADVLQCDKQAFGRFFHGMLQRGVYFAPSAYEAGFVSVAHTEADIAKTIQIAEEVFKET